jgi:hypothetical protein
VKRTEVEAQPKRPNERRRIEMKKLNVIKLEKRTAPRYIPF